MSDELIRTTKRDIEIATLGRMDGLVTHTTEHARALVSAIESLTAERDRLAAELAELRAQEPVGFYWERIDTRQPESALLFHGMPSRIAVHRSHSGELPCVPHYVYAAPVPAQVPDDWVLVPRFPTEKMLMEGCDAMEENHETSRFGLCHGCGWEEVSAAYAAMLAAAQKGGK